MHGLYLHLKDGTLEGDIELTSKTWNSVINKYTKRDNIPTGGFGGIALLVSGYHIRAEINHNNVNEILHNKKYKWDYAITITGAVLIGDRMEHIFNEIIGRMVDYTIETFFNNVSETFLDCSIDPEWAFNNPYQLRYNKIVDKSTSKEIYDYTKDAESYVDSLAEVLPVLGCHILDGVK